MTAVRLTRVTGPFETIRTAVESVTQGLDEHEAPSIPAYVGYHGRNRGAGAAGTGWDRLLLDN